MRILRGPVFLLLLSCFVVRLSAQTEYFTCAVAGRVTLPDGRPAADVDVKANELGSNGTGLARIVVTRTNSDGHFALTLFVGRYIFTVNKILMSENRVLYYRGKVDVGNCVNAPVTLSTFVLSSSRLSSAGSQ